MTTAELIKKFYGADVPYTARHRIVNIVRRLVEKTALLDGDCRVFKSERAGSKPVEVWIQAKRRHRASA